MILVTGAGGFLGRRLVHRLAEQGNSPIRCLVRPGSPTDFFDSLRSNFSSLDIQVIFLNFNDKNALIQAFRDVRVVYHAAASKSGSAASMVANTVVGSENIYEASVIAGVLRFVLVSSFAVIGVKDLPRGHLIDETVPMEDHPEWRDEYAFSKHRQEKLAWKYFRDRNLPLVVVRPGVIFGPGEKILTPRIGINLFGFFLELGGGNDIPLTYVENCADAIVLAGNVEGIQGDVFCVVDDDIPKGRDILKRYKRDVAPLYSIPFPYPLLQLLARCNVWYSNHTKGHLPVPLPPYLVASIWKRHRFSNRKAKQMLGWIPKVPMAEALDRTFASLRI